MLVVFHAAPCLSLCHVMSHCSCEQQCHLVTLCMLYCQFDFEQDQRQQLVLMPQVEQAVLTFAQIQGFFFSSVIYLEWDPPRCP